MRRLAVLLSLVAILATSSMATGAKLDRNFITHLDGDDAGAITRAQGQAIFHLNKEGTELNYRLIAANIQNVTQAHIHLAPVGEDGPVVVWLYPDTPPPTLIPGRFSGVLATGTITAADLVGPLAGMDLSGLVDEIRAGNTYVNVHTEQYPAGEIRGQIR